MWRSSHSIIAALALAAAGAACGPGAPPPSPPPSAQGEPDVHDAAVGAAAKDPELADAVKALAALPRPWTVPVLLAAQAAEADAARRVQLTRLLASSRDPRAAVRLGEELDRGAQGDAVTAAHGLLLYFADGLPEGGTEQAIEGAQAWWRAHRAELRRAAGPR